MGEYIEFDGESLKLGTCEDLLYVTYDKLATIVESRSAKRLGGNLEPREYLKESYGFRYRFPFPPEMPTGDSCEPGYAVNVWAKDFAGDFEHARVYNRVANVNVWTPCIWSKAWDTVKPGGEFGHSPLPETMTIELVQQKLRGGVLVPVFRCGCCRAKFRVESPNKIAEITKAILDVEGGRLDAVRKGIARRLIATMEELTAKAVAA